MGDLALPTKGEITTPADELVVSLTQSRAAEEAEPTDEAAAAEARAGARDAQERGASDEE
ncbi:MAG: hypothetical protein U0Z44_20705 [Kouleothrix sp.]